MENQTKWVPVDANTSAILKTLPPCTCRPGADQDCAACDQRHHIIALVQQYHATYRRNFTDMMQIIREETMRHRLRRGMQTPYCTACDEFILDGEGHARSCWVEHVYETGNRP